MDINALKASKRVGINIATVKIERKTTKDIGTKTKKPIKVSKKQLNCGNMGKARIKSAIGIKKHSQKPVKASKKTKLRQKD